jgi:hypothetical protein
MSQKVHQFRMIILLSFLSLYSLSSATFRRLLSTSPLLSLSRLMDTVVTRRRSYGSAREVHRCQFIDITNPDASGGAIRSSAGLRVVNTLFRGCESRSGGAISITNSASLEFVTADCCAAEDCGAFEMRTEESHQCHFTLSLFLDTFASRYGAVSRHSWGMFVVSSSNFTRTIASDCIGCMEADYGSTTMRFSAVCDAAAGQQNGGLCMRHLTSLRIESCRFERCSHVSMDVESAAALLVVDCPLAATVRGCAFVDIDVHTIAVVKGHVLSVVECCFAGKSKRELPNLGIANWNCSFGEQNCEAGVKPAGGGAGYNPIRSIEQVPTEAAQHRRRSHVELFVQAMIVGVIVPVLIVGLSIVRRAERRPKAFEGQ